MTAEGYRSLEEELVNLRTVKRNEISEKIRIARGFGDLSENSEYDEAKNEQAIVEARIIQLEEQLNNAEILSVADMARDVVCIGSVVKLRDVEFSDTMEYRIVTSVESNAAMNTITDESPVGKALIGHKVGDIVNVKVPSGIVIQYEIQEISL
jgi:transcription elongation factor GreA